MRGKGHQRPAAASAARSIPVAVAAPRLAGQPAAHLEAGEGRPARRCAAPGRPGAARVRAAGPAGSNQPLPMPRSSKTQISMSRAGVVLQSVVAHDDLGVRVGGQQGAGGFEPAGGHEDRDLAAVAISSGSSPTSAARLSARDFAAVAAAAAMAARHRRPRCRPRERRCSTSAITTGVLPAPPATTLPTTTTGTADGASAEQAHAVGSRGAGHQRAKDQGERPQQAGRAGPAPQPRRAAVPARAPWSAASGLGRRLGGEGDLRQARAARGFHHRDDGLVARRGVGADDDHGVLAGLGRLAAGQWPPPPRCGPRTAAPWTA